MRRPDETQYSMDAPYIGLLVAAVAVGAFLLLWLALMFLAFGRRFADNQSRMLVQAERITNAVERIAAKVGADKDDT